MAVEWMDLGKLVHRMDRWIEGGRLIPRVPTKDGLERMDGWMDPKTRFVAERTDPRSLRGAEPFFWAFFLDFFFFCSISPTSYYESPFYMGLPCLVDLA